MRRWLPVLAILAVQAICALVFVYDILAGILGLRRQPIAWRVRELIEIGAALGLILGLVLGAIALWRTMQQSARDREKLRRASIAFHDVLEERFRDWSLTPAERDVALFSIKGLSTSEIAGIRGTSEGTIKAQTGAIYRKAGVGGRAQLLALFVEELMEADGAPAHRVVA